MANVVVESFVFYKSFYDSTKNLKDSDKLLVFNAIFSYTFEAKEEKLKGIPAIIWTLIKPNIDAAINNRINGRKGGRPKKEEKTERGVIENKKGGLFKKENPAFEKTKTNEDVNEDVNENEDENENVNEDNILPFSDPLPETPQLKKTSKKTEPVIEIPKALNSEEFLQTWEKWKQYRKELKKPLKPSTQEMQLKRFEKEGALRSIEAMILSMESGWQGFVWEKVGKKSQEKFDAMDFLRSI